MKISRERQILLSLLLVGGAALGIDRLIGKPGASVAQPPVAPVETPPTSFPSPVAPNALRRATLAQRLQVAAGDTPLTQSAFLVPSAWSDQVVPAISKVPAAPSEDVIRPFIATHRLEGTLVLGQMDTAIINGQVVTIGQSIDGFRLVQVNTQEAILERGPARVTLRFKTPFPIGSSPTPDQVPLTAGANP